MGTQAPPRDLQRKQRNASTPWQARIVVLASIWGMSFVFIKVGDEALAPIQVALGRMVIGTATLIALLLIRRERLPSGSKVWFQLAIAAVLFNSAPFYLFAYGETHITSVLAGILNATTPLLTLVAAMAFLPEERPTATRVAGLLTGFAGVLVVLGFWRGIGGGALLGSLACLGAAACYGVGFPFTRKYLSGRSESVVALSTAQLLCGTIELAIITPFLSHAPSGVPLNVAGSLLGLGALGTGIAYVLNYGVIRDAGATNASLVTYIVPIFATVAGIVFLGEHLTWNEPVGAVIVILGVAISQGRVRLPARRTSHEAAASREAS